jgi:hypothetical protein
MRVPRSLLVAIALVTVGTTNSEASQVALDFSGGSSYFASQDSGSPYTIGWSFTTTQTFTLTGLGFWDEADHTLGFSHDVGLWDSSQNLLASTTITSASTAVASAGPGQWLFNSTETVTLSAGTYFIGATYLSTDNVDAYRYYPASVATISGLTFDAARYVYGPGLNFPGNFQGGNAYFGPNLELSSVPEPSSLVLLSLAAMIVVAARGYRRWPARG